MASLIPHKWVFSPSSTMARVQCLGGPELLLWCQSTQVRGETCPLGFKCSAGIWDESLSSAFSVPVRALLPGTKSSKVFYTCTCGSVVAATLACGPPEKNPGGVLQSQNRLQLHAVGSVL